MVAHLSGSSVSCAVIFLFATLHEGKLLLVEIVEMSNLMGKIFIYLAVQRAWVQSLVRELNPTGCN